MNMPGFWIYQGCKYTSGSEYSKVLNWPGLVNMPEHAGICMNMSKSAWMTFVLLDSLVIPCLLECMVTYFNEVDSLKEYSSWKYLIFFILD